MFRGEATMWVGPEPRMIHRGGHAQVPDLRIGEDLVDGEDRPARDAGRLQPIDPLGAGLLRRLLRRSPR